MITLCYARVSRKEQSLETQLYLFQQAGFDELFVEKISGRSGDRPEFQRCCDRAFALASEGKEVEVLFVEFNRWGRDTSSTLAMVAKLEKAGVKLRELEGGSISVASADKLLSTGMKALLAHYYSLELSGKIKRAYDRRRAEGRPLCGNAPFGYRYSADHRKLEPDPVQWPIAREIVQRLIEGQSKYKIRQWLLEAHGLRRSGDGINRLVRCEAWRGNLVDNRNNRVIYGAHEPLISEDERRELAARIELNRRLKGKNQGKIYPIPSGGIVRCAACGFAEQTSTTQGRRYFRCIELNCSWRNKYLRSEAIEAAIQEAIVDAAAELGAATLASEVEHVTDPRIEQLEAELRQLEPLAHRPAVALEIEQIRLELGQIEAAPASDEAEAAERRELVSVLAQLSSDDWASLPAEERRGIHSALVELVEEQGHEILSVRLRC